MTRYMMATKAIHQLGDISREEPDLCVIHDEDEENYIGNWVTGFGFVDVKFPKSTTRELTNKEKEYWHGRQITIGGMPTFTIYVKDIKPNTGKLPNWVLPQVVKDSIRPDRIGKDLQRNLQRIIKKLDEQKESPIIILPEDKTRKQQLRDKLTEYKGREHPYRPPELQMDTICKITVLERLLRDGQVNTWGLSREMAETYGSGFDVNAFNNACGVIEDYYKTGGQKMRGGTGLRAPKQIDSKRLRPGYPPMGRKVRVFKAAKIYGHHLTIGMTGRVNEGAYCGGIFDYTRECPVQFRPRKNLPETIGVPWEILEFAD